jgi:hypothetical protein
VKSLVFRCQRVAGLRDRNDSARLNHPGLTPPNSHTRSFTAGTKIWQYHVENSIPAAYSVYSITGCFPLDAII